MNDQNEDELREALKAAIVVARRAIAQDKKHIRGLEELIFLGENEINENFGELECLLDVFKIELAEDGGKDERKNDKRNKGNKSDDGFVNDFE